MKSSLFLTVTALIGLSFMTSGCTAIGVLSGGAAATGVAAASEGGIKGTLTDAGIQATISDLWFQYDLETFSKLNLTVNQGRVLVTGVVQDPEHRVEAIRLAWQPNGVKQVINEIQVAEGEGIKGFARDAWITSRLRASLTLDQDVQSINYSLETVQGIIYLMGVAQSQAELNRVMEIARTIPDVKRVVSYVKIVGEQIEAQNVQSGNVNAQWKTQAPTPEGNSQAASNQPVSILTPEPVTSQKPKSNDNSAIETYQLPY